MQVAVPSDIHDQVWNLEKVVNEVKSNAEIQAVIFYPLNPGPVCGLNKGKPTPASYAIYHTQTNAGEIMKIA